MNKKGFTLVELLAVITILGLLVIIAIPSINSVSQKTKKKMCETKRDLAEQNLILWAQDNKQCFLGGEDDDCLGCDNTTCEVSYDELAQNGLIEYDEGKYVINPIDKKPINDKKITIIFDKNNRSFEIDKNNTNQLDCGE